MPAYSREGSAWEQSVMRQRDAGAWTGQDASGYVRVGSEWVQFQGITADNLGQPVSLIATPGDLEATVSWTNDLNELVNQDNVRVQYRLPETTPVWTEETYPITSATFGFLTAETEYQFQVRYITRDPDDGTIELEGPISELFFTTTALDGPGTPAADPGGTGPDSIVNWPNIGGTVGSGCWWEYYVQTATTPASGAITWADATTLQQIDGTIETENVDYVNDLGLACGQLARLRYRENCDGVPGDFEFGEAFVIVCDWGAACGDIPASTQFANEALYSDPNIMFAFPELCGTDIVDHVDQTIILGKLPGFGSIQTFNGPHTVYGLTTNGTLGVPTLGGQFGALALLVDGDDITFNLQVQLEEVPGGSGGGGGTAPASFPIARFGRNVAISAVFDTTTTFVARATWIDAAGNFRSITGSAPLSLDEFHTIGLTMDANGVKTLYVDGTVDDTNPNTIAMAFSGAGIGQDVEVYTNEFMRFRAIAAWDRVLTADEMLALHNPSPILANADFYWPMNEGSISFPLNDAISSQPLSELTAPSTAVVETSPINSENIYSLDKGQYEATIGSGTAWNGLTGTVEHHVDNAAYSITALDQYVTQYSVRDNGTEYIVVRVIMDYTHPAGWHWAIDLLDSGNTWQRVQTSANRTALGVKGKMPPFVFTINAAGTEVSFTDWTGTVTTQAIPGTGQLHHVGAAATLDQGLYKFYIGDASSIRSPSGQIGRLAIQKAGVTALEMVDFYWDLWGGVPTEYSIRDHITLTGINSVWRGVVVPTGKTTIELDVIGSSGRGSTSASGSGHSGKGHRMTVSKSVTAGDVIWVNCGGTNMNDDFFTNVFGQTGMRLNRSLGGLAGALNTDRAEVSSGTPFGDAEQQVIGAGGGGHYAGGIGGDGGYPSGTAAVAAGAAGGPGTQVAGGAAAGTGTAGSRSAPGVGANGSGGDGYYGGGAGSFGSSSAQGGGGGSSYYDSGVWTLVSNGVYDPGFTPGTDEDANGNIVIRFS